MANDVITKLLFAVPHEHREDFLSAIQGPDNWVYPREARNASEINKPEISNHVKISTTEGTDELEDIIRRFHEYMEPFGWPAEMKPSKTDLEIFLTDPSLLCPKSVEFSIPKLVPWNGAEEIERFLPSQEPEAMLWIRPDPLNTSILRFTQEKIGAKWAPHLMTVEVNDSDSDFSVIYIEYETPWTPISSIEEILGPVCLKYGARFLLVWVEEQGLCGYTYHDPEADALEEQNWGLDDHEWFYTIKEDEHVFEAFDDYEFFFDITEKVSDTLLDITKAIKW